MWITGHRGQVVAGGPPENTLAAVSDALDGGAQGVEVDVRVSADGVAVVSHDPTLARVAGHRALVSATAYEELARLPLPGGHRIARLDEVAHLVGGHGDLVVEVKGGRGGCAHVPPVLSALAAARPDLELVISSFCPAVLATVRRLEPSIRRALVVGPHRSAQAALEDVVVAGHHELHAHVRTLFADHEIVDRAHRSGVVVASWTVNREIDARLLGVAGVDRVITDDPGALLAALAKPGGRTVLQAA